MITLTRLKLDLNLNSSCFLRSERSELSSVVIDTIEFQLSLGRYYLNEGTTLAINSIVVNNPIAVHLFFDFHHVGSYHW